MSQTETSHPGVMQHGNEFSEFEWPPQSPDPNPVKQLWDVEEWEIGSMNMQLAEMT